MEIKKFNARIYAIRSFITDKIYIGSTIETLSSRMSKHRYCYRKYQNESEYKKFCTSYYILELEGAYIELISEHNDISKDELRRLEGEEIRKNKDICVNKLIAGQTKKEWIEKNEKNIKKKKHEYYAMNSDKILEKTKLYYNDNRETCIEKIKNYYKNNKDNILQYQKEYAKNNKDKIREYKKEHAKNNKEKINEYRKIWYRNKKNKINV